MNVKDLQQLKNLASFSATHLEKLASELFIKTFEKMKLFLTRTRRPNSFIS